MRKNEDADKVVLMLGFARLSVVGMSISIAVVLALFIFMMTAILLLTGDPGDQFMGDNLKKLWVFFPGYTVSMAGSFIGAAYGALFGLIGGFLIALLWNLTHYIYIGLVVIRSLWWRMMAE